jgi:Arylsulfotransferase (ASST)
MRARRLAGPLGAVALLVLVSTPTAADAAVRLAVNGLEPGFRPAILDYTVDCAQPLSFRVRTPGGAEAKIGARPWSDGPAHRTVRLRDGQQIRVVARSGARKRAYRVRCLPEDFPEYEFRRGEKPASDFYLLTPAASAGARFVTIFDRRGVPVWWYEDAKAPVDAKVLADGTLVWTQFAGAPFTTDPSSSYEFHSLDGRRIGRLRTAGGAITDQHDLQPTPSGNFLLLAYVPRAEPVDLSEFLGDPSARVYDAVIQELTPGGELVWEWSSEGQIDFSETGRWWQTLDSEPYDYAHVNAVEPLPGGDLLVSLRHTDAVYRIDRRSGAIEWKLGGTPTPESLRVQDDPLGDFPFGGQHDVRALARGDLSVFDNGTGLGRPPRALRYRIEGDTATLLESHSTPSAPVSVCCGSARFARGSALVSWGGTELISEITRSGATAFELEFAQSFSYRAVPVEGELSRRQLRAGMNAQVSPKR